MKSSRQIFVDLDGVLADLDTYYQTCFGVRPNQDTYEPPDMWDNIRRHGTFYQHLPLMSDAMKLWEGIIERFHPRPIILTGIPRSIPGVEHQKRMWVRDHLGAHVKVICCWSRDKQLHGGPGEILIDDRLKYSTYWLRMGGVFVHHSSADDTLGQLEHLCYPVPFGV